MFTKKYIMLGLIFILSIVIKICIAQTDYCGARKTCGECVQNPKCAWHIQTVDNKHHCKTAPESDEGKNVINPQTEAHTSDPEIGHLKPNNVKLRIRPGQSYTLNFVYTHKVDYPVDMYFLMDMSNSMQHYRNSISVLASEIVKEMKERTTDVQIGFGSFVDKTILPYVNALPNRIAQTCDKCETPYSFKNRLKLTENVIEFSNKVKNTLISANIDGPEGSLEALLQTIVCTEEIGWREKARHLIILSTDDAFHAAGDGKLAGIVEPNDGRCHLENDEYTHGLLHDYPSIGQIKERAANKSMNILFLVTTSQEILYSKLQEVVKNTYLGTLQSNSENVVNLVTQFYQNITDSVEFTNNFPPNNFDIKMSSKNCKQFENNKCSGISNDDNYEFSVNITLKRCPDEKIYTNQYIIKPGSIADEIKLQVEMLCDCPCEHKGNEGYEENSYKCNQNGDTQCGICKCRNDKIGDECQCNANEKEKNDIDSSKCVKSDSKEICSRAGECKCGQCFCTPPFSGTHCECNNQTCITNKDENIMCSNQGLCDCGICKCFKEWSGSKCDCYELPDKCIRPGNETHICSENGVCKCGKCECTDKEKYGGKYCEDCKTCPKTCGDFENCVKCFYDEKVDCEEKCNKFVINEILENMNITDYVCNYHDEDTCLISFAFKYNKDDRSAEVYTQKTCSPTQAGITSLIYIMSSILLAGIIAMLIWRLVTYITDRREYEKFYNETKNPQWNTEENPLFKKATSEFQNPLFEKSK